MASRSDGDGVLSFFNAFAAAAAVVESLRRSPRILRPVVI